MYSPLIQQEFRAFRSPKGHEDAPTTLKISEKGDVNPVLTDPLEVQSYYQIGAAVYSAPHCSHFSLIFRADKLLHVHVTNTQTSASQSPQ